MRKHSPPSGSLENGPTFEPHSSTDLIVAAYIWPLIYNRMKRRRHTSLNPIKSFCAHDTVPQQHFKLRRVKTQPKHNHIVVSIIKEN